MENKREEEFARLAGHTVGGVLIVLLISLKGYLAELADIHREIVPAGFIYVIINVFGLHNANDIIGIEYTVTVRVGLIVPLYPALNIVLGNIEPEANSLCVFKNYCISVNAESYPSVLLGVRILRGKTVGFKAHRVVAVVHLTVGFVSQGKIEIIIPVSCVLSVIDYVPFVDICLTVLEVPKHLGCLAEIKLNGCRGVLTHIQGCRYRARNICGRISLADCYEA